MMKYPEQQKRLIERPNRGVRVWLILGIHATIFTIFTLIYPRLEAARPDLFDTNLARFVMPAWAVILALHLLLAYIADLRFLVRRARAERIRMRLKGAGSARRSLVPVQRDEFAYSNDIPQFTRTHSNAPAPTTRSRRGKKTPPPTFYTPQE